MALSAVRVHVHHQVFLTDNQKKQHSTAQHSTAQHSTAQHSTQNKHNYTLKENPQVFTFSTGMQPDNTTITVIPCHKLQVFPYIFQNIN
ncbi:TPA: hypothetical protein JEY12_004501 [Escherichia coli]|nr:hypothetical protein [Escherichia coli]